MLSRRFLYFVRTDSCAVQKERNAISNGGFFVSVYFKSAHISELYMACSGSTRIQFIIQSSHIQFNCRNKHVNRRRQRELAYMHTHTTPVERHTDTQTMLIPSIKCAYIELAHTRKIRRYLCNSNCVAVENVISRRNTTRSCCTLELDERNVGISGEAAA